jgi:hypothetical protein
MSINGYIIYHKIKIMEMGGRKEILLGRETINTIILPESVATSLIMQGILPEMIATSSINPSLKGATIYSRRLVVILTHQIIAP